jgi:hypothetical protein
MGPGDAVRADGLRMPQGFHSAEPLPLEAAAGFLADRISIGLGSLMRGIPGSDSDCAPRLKHPRHQAPLRRNPGPIRATSNRKYAYILSGRPSQTSRGGAQNVEKSEAQPQRFSWVIEAAQRTVRAAVRAVAAGGGVVGSSGASASDSQGLRSRRTGPVSTCWHTPPSRPDTGRR